MVLLGYAIVAYGAFVFSMVWAIGFFVNWGPLNSVDGPATSPAWAAIAINAALLLAFAAQHTVMARAGFKERLSRLIPPAAERSTFVLAASLLMCALLGWWQPVPAVIWAVAGPWSVAIVGVYVVGWIIVVWSTFMVDHADFLGLKQAYGHLRQQRYRPPGFSQRWMYQWCRHPMMFGLVLVFWSAPRMTVGHLLFAFASTAYIAIGIRFEERALRAELGAVYVEYARRVPAIVPIPRLRAPMVSRVDESLPDSRRPTAAQVRYPWRDQETPSTGGCGVR